MRNRVLMLIAIGALSGASNFAAEPATKPADPVSPSGIEVRGMEEFNRGMYAMALPMLQKAAVLSKDQPDHLATLQEDIRVCQKNIALANGALAVNTVPVSPTTQPVLAGQISGGLNGGMRTPHPAPKSGVVQDMAIKDLGNFDYDPEKGGNIPKDVLAMNDSSIRLDGYMIPMDQAESITRFALVPSLFSCCYGQPPQIQHTIVVQTPKGKAVNYYPDEIAVQGILHVNEKKEDGFIVSVFDIDATSVKPAPK